MLSYREKQELAAKLLKLSLDEVGECSGEIKEINGLYGSVLFADSSVDEEVHYQDFLNGKRTPIEEFDMD